MNNDLISREALKKDFKSRLSLCNGWIVNAKDKETKIRASAVKAFIAEVLMTIDNAPTVFSCNACKNMGNEWECRDCHDYSNYIHYEERPQGKWNEIQAGMFACPFCGARPHKDFKNFCAKCGADMRKGGAV